MPWYFTLRCWGKPGEEMEKESFDTKRSWRSIMEIIHGWKEEDLIALNHVRVCLSCRFRTWLIMNIAMRWSQEWNTFTVHKGNWRTRGTAEHITESTSKKYQGNIEEDKLQEQFQCSWVSVNCPQFREIDLNFSIVWCLWCFFNLPLFLVWWPITWSPAAAPSLLITSRKLNLRKWWLFLSWNSSLSIRTQISN